MKPSAEVRAVMERMFASDKEIASGRASRLTGDTKAAYEKALADLQAAGVKNAEANAYIAAKMAERLSSAYKEAGEDRSAVSLLPEIQAQEKSAQNEKETVRKKYEGKKEWLKAPNGEDTNLTEDQWLTVRTPAFKKWFGDWENDPKNASKVVDENGEPLVVYYGTNTKHKGKMPFNIFDTEKIGSNTKAPETPIGSYFTSNKMYAEGIARDAAYRNRDGRGKKQVIGTFFLGKGAYKFIDDDINDEYIATRLNQIKSATDNIGTFDATSNDIRFSLAEEGKTPEQPTKPTFKETLKNIFFGLRSKENKQYRSIMKHMLEDVTDMKIRFGKMPKNEEIIFKEFERVIASKEAYNWDRLMPNVGRAVAKRLNLNATEEMNKTIGNWILGQAREQTPKLDAFEKALKKDEAFGNKMIELQTTFIKWNEKTAMERNKSIIQMSQKERWDGKKARQTFYDQMVEELEPINRLTKEIEEKSGKKIADALNPMKAFRRYRGAGGKAITLIEGIGQQAVEGIQANFPTVDFKGFKTLKMILDEAGALNDSDKQLEFMVYAVAKHLKDLHTDNNLLKAEIEKLERMEKNIQEDANQASEEAENIKTQSKESGMKRLTPQENTRLEALKEKLQENKKVIEGIQKQMKEMEDKVKATPMTESDCDAIIKENEKRFGQAQKDLVAFSNKTAEILADSGVISYKRYNEMKDKYPNYVPLFRVFEENEEINFGDSLKHMIGSGRDIINPLHSIIRNTYMFVKKAEKNKAKQLLAGLTRVGGVGKLLEEVEGETPNTKTTVMYYVNGEKRFLEADPTVVKAVNEMGVANYGWFFQFLHGVTSFARACFTTASPEFAIRNLFRDGADAFVYGGKGVIMPWDIVKGLFHAIMRDRVYYEWLSSGAAQASIYSIDRDYTQSTIDKMNGGRFTGAFKRAKKAFKYDGFIGAGKQALFTFKDLLQSMGCYRR